MKLREFGDTKTTREYIYKNIIEGFKKSFPKEGKQVRLKIENLEIPDKHFSKNEQKKAIINDRDLTLPLKGTMILEDKKTGKQLDKKKLSLGQVLYYTPKRGTFVGHGTEFSVGNQMRLRPGTYTRVKSNAEIETQFNTEGKMGFRVSMEPKTGIFRFNIKNNKLRLYPILKAFSVPDENLEEFWGKDLLKVNKVEDKAAIDRLYKNLSGYNYNKELNLHEKAQEVIKEFKGLKLSPEITKETLGESFKNVSPKALLKATKRILNVYQGKEKADDRDSLKYKTFWGVEDFIRERIEKDSGRLGKKLLWKLDKQKNFDKMPSGYFTKWFKQIVRGDSRAFPLEEINPLQLYDNLHRNIVMGEGGVGNLELVTMDSRNVNPSHFGYIDAFRGPESAKIGIDTRLAINTYKGDDKKIYSRFIDSKTKKPVYMQPSELVGKTIAFPGEMDKKGKMARAMLNGEIKFVNKKDVDCFLKEPEEMFSIYSLLVPMFSGVSGPRTFMAGKMYSDTLPLINPEAPIVRSRVGKQKDLDFETYFPQKVLTEAAPVDGIVDKITKNEIIVKGKDGKKEKIDLYNNFPLSRKTYMKNIPRVKVGDKVKKGEIIAYSNYTDNKGALAVGKHLNAAYWPYKGLTYEDGIVISDSAAKKFTSEQMYKVEVPIDENVNVNRKSFISSFPSIYTSEQLKNFDDNGILKPGAKVNKNDPLILATKRKTLSAQDLALGNLHKSLRKMNDDASAIWEHDDPGEISDVALIGKKAKIYIKTKTPAKVGDKLTGRFGNKGVISSIVPDNEMPVVKRTGERLEMALHPAGVTSRMNPAQIYEGLLGKIGKEKGIIYRMPIVSEGSYVDFTEKELKKHNIPDEEIIVENDGREIPVMITNPYFLKLSQMAEAKMSARDFGSYTSDLQPSKGNASGDGGAIKMGGMELAAMIGHGAKLNVKEMAILKGQKNDDFWRAYQLGYPTPSPDVPFSYHKFLALLKAAGANVEKRGDILKIKPLTDKEISKISNGEIRVPKFLLSKNLSPERGGFFDIGLTGGVTGKMWNHLNLTEPMPSPLLEKPIRILLGLNEKTFRNIVAGKEKLNGKIGGKAIKEALSKININKEISDTNALIPKVAKTNKDKLIKKLKILKGIKNSEIVPEEMVVSKIAVLPPIFRPIASTGTGTIIVSDPNKLYQDLFYSNQALGDLKKELPDDMLVDERLGLYDVIKATVGTGEHVNPEFRQTKVKSFLKTITGEQPKTGFFFKKTVSKNQDLVGRAVVVPDPNVGMDEVGLPEEIAWKVYKPFIMRNLVRRGYQALQADEEILKRTPAALNELEGIMKNRPVLINRAPTLHKFNIMAAFPKLNKHKSLSVSPLISGPFNLDHDGDAMQIHVPVADEAVQEAIDKMLPSKNLFSMKDYKIHYMPTQDDNFGLYVGSTKDKKNKPVPVKNINELTSLLDTGKINFDDRVNIKEG